MKHLGKKTATILAILLIIGGAVAALEFTDTTHIFHEPSSAASGSDINYGPPTDAEKQDSESHKDSLPEKDDDSPKNNGSAEKKHAVVEITTWAQKSSTLNVNGFVSNLIEEDGTCTLTLIDASNPANKTTQSRQAEPNANDTDCGAIDVPLSKLHSGTWNATLSYSSPTAVGTSDVTALEVTK